MKHILFAAVVLVSLWISAPSVRSIPPGNAVPPVTSLLFSDTLNIPGTWKMQLAWTISHVTATNTWTINTNGTFASSTKATGTWFNNGPSITLTYASGVLCSGTVHATTPLTMNGTMTYKDGDYGVWSAVQLTNSLSGGNLNNKPPSIGAAPKAM